MCVTYWPSIGLPIDIRQLGPSNAACRTDLRRAQQAEIMPRAPRHLGAIHAEHAWSTVRSRPRPTASRGPLDPHINGKPVPRSTRGYAACSWTPRCTRTMSCDRWVSRSASQRRYRRATCGPQNGRLERAARDLRCRVCCGDGAGSMGRAARPCARRTRYLTFTHTGSPVSRR